VEEVLEVIKRPFKEIMFYIKLRGRTLLERNNTREKDIWKIEKKVYRSEKH